MPIIQDKMSIRTLIESLKGIFTKIEILNLLSMDFRNSVFLFSFLLVVGCSQNKLDELQVENKRYKVTVDSLEVENIRNKVIIDSLENVVMKIKDSDKYIYQKGVELLKNGRVEEAKSEFQAVVDKYPKSPLAPLAERQIKDIKEKQLAEEKRRIAEEKYKPRSPSIAIEEWKNFRANENKYKGTITTWRFPISYFISSENPLGCLDEAAGKITRQYKVVVNGPEGFTYQAAAFLGKVPIVKEEDWIVVTGNFLYVSSDNVVVLSPIRIINEGYK